MYIPITYTLERESKVLENIISVFSLNNVLNNLFEFLLQNLKKKINYNLGEFYINIQGGLVVIKKYSPHEAQNEMITINKIIKSFRKVKSRLEKVNYLEDNEIQSKTKLCFTSLYDLEIELKKIAFSDSHIKRASTDFIYTLSSKSKSSLSEALA